MSSPSSSSRSPSPSPLHLPKQRRLEESDAKDRGASSVVGLAGAVMAPLYWPLPLDSLGPFSSHQRCSSFRLESDGPFSSQS
jgi:hypothetical protein